MQNNNSSQVKLEQWSDIFNKSEMQIALRLKIASVEASGWALGKTQNEIETEARRRLMEGE